MTSTGKNGLNIRTNASPNQDIYDELKQDMIELISANIEVPMDI